MLAGEYYTTHVTLSVAMKCILPSLFNKLKAGSRGHSELVKNVTDAATNSLHDVFSVINGRQPRDCPSLPPLLLSCVPSALALLKNHITKEINKFGVYVSDSTI
ncbi:hypothetical protein E2C01_031694 [Portunus trituberculatus]|uniref:Uncharacterized protein n=1 Tax=Portunus trituberculatus TaxID=210409 RepID=A0A5B7ETF3_PORTR|nr:hypothetical protein [Portunus trituberculatus]